jgi:hypothetical protein
VTAHAAAAAVLELVLMLVVAAAYAVAARRFRVLWHPLSIVVAVGTVGVVVSVLGEVSFGGGTAGVPAMLRRSAIGGFGWGVAIAVVAWIGRRILVRPPGP